MKKSPVPFRLQFSPKDILVYASRYPSAEDADAMEAGRQINEGRCTRRNLETIFRWKTGGRGITRLQKNTDAEIADALSLAVAAKTERSSIAILIGLCGVAVPVASAILTAINPDKYTIIDFRALEALGTDSKNRTIDFYLKYLDACRCLSQRHGITLRELDRALWQWSSKRHD